MGFCFVHAADLHLDTPFEGLGAVSGELGEKLRDASLAALDRLTDLAIRRRAAFVLLAGDIYDGPERGLRAEFRLRDAARKLFGHGIPLFAVFGNHDPLEGWGAVREWPPNVVFFGSAEVESHAAEREGVRLATVHGISFPERCVRENLAARFHRTAEPGLHIGLLHANAGGVPDHDPYAPCSTEDLARAGMDYWALGHIHARREFAAGGSLAVYPGNTQGRSFKPSELGPKGVTVVTVEGSRLRCEFEPVDAVRFAECAVDISELGDLGLLLDVLRDQASGLSAGAEGRETLVRAVLKGRGPVHAELRRADRRQALLDELRQDGAALRPPVFWAELLDATAAAMDREAVRGRGDFAAELVGAVDRLMQDPQRLEQFAREACEQGHVPPLRRWLEEPTAEEWRELLAAAERTALEELADRLDEEGA